jgi:DNA polymerase-3 subunit gamma/tau
MYQVIARKYRPQSFAELISQEHVRTTLENAISQGRIAHGYIFSGQRGTGKTTVARILARCLNCQKGPTISPCGVCASCTEIAAGGAMDVIEIDAASNRGINEMRELRENVRFRPARDRYKIFIVDEAHQITNEAFNALLKTLEEPPEWVVFILCTTEAHKIPTTIASRCQQFSFRSVDFSELVARIEWIVGQENIEADAETLSVLAQAGEGSVRDSLSALDQAIACCGARLNAGEVRTLLGMFALESLARVTQALADSDPARMLEIVGELDANGRSLQHFCRELARYFRNLLVVKISGTESRLLAASPAERKQLSEAGAQFSEEDLTRYLAITLDLFKEMQESLQPKLHLEMGLLRLVHAGRMIAVEQALAGTGGRNTPPAPARQTPSPAPLPQTPKASQGAKAQPAGSGLRERLYSTLLELGQQFTADAVAHAELAESTAGLCFTVPKEYALALRPADLDAAVRQLLGRPAKIQVTVAEVAGAAPPALAPEPADAVTQRALEHPEVRRFQETFPESQVRTVRNLRD